MNPGATGSLPVGLKAFLGESDRTLAAPGVVDAPSARPAARAGFEVLSATGAGLANTRCGLPDPGIRDAQETADVTARRSCREERGRAAGLTEEPMQRVHRVQRRRTQR